MRRKHYLVQLFSNALATDDFQSVGIAGKCFTGLILYLEVELCGKAHTTHHAKGIVAERDVGVERSGNNAILQVGHAIERVYQLSETLLVQAYCHSIDGKVATVLVVLQRSVLHMGFATVMAIALLAGSHKLHFERSAFHLSCTEIAEHRQMCLAPQHCLKARGHLNAATHHHHIDIVGRPLQKEVAHISAYHIAGQMQRIGCLRYLVKYISIEYLSQLAVGKYPHKGSSDF